MHLYSSFRRILSYAPPKQGHRELHGGGMVARGGGAMPLRRSLKELAGGGCYTHGAPTELAASVGPGLARTDADGNVGAPVALHHKSRPLRGLPFYLRPHARHSHASSAGSRRSSLAPPRLLHSVSALELTDLRARRSGTQRRRTSRPAFGRSGRTTLGRGGWRRTTGSRFRALAASVSGAFSRGGDVFEAGAGV